MINEIFTVGHSNHTTEKLLSLLRTNAVTAIADVRSSPRTRINPDFSAPQIEYVLSEAGIRYAFLGEELGARSPDESCYEDGKVRYDRLARRTIFQDGLDRIEMGAEKFRIALLCAEREPLECHRCVLVARHLAKRGLEVSHILADGSTERHAQTLLRLKKSLGLLDQKDMFMDDDSLTEIAYEMQEKKIAFQLPEEKIPDLVA